MSAVEFLLLRSLLLLNSCPLCVELLVTMVKVSEVWSAIAVSFEGRIDSREGGREECLPSSAANLRRSKLLKYWCNTHVSPWTCRISDRMRLASCNGRTRQSTTVMDEASPTQ